MCAAIAARIERSSHHDGHVSLPNQASTGTVTITGIVTATATAAVAAAAASPLLEKGCAASRRGANIITAPGAKKLVVTLDHRAGGCLDRLEDAEVFGTQLDRRSASFEAEVAALRRTVATLSEEQFPGTGIMSGFRVRVGFCFVLFCFVVWSCFCFCFCFCFFCKNTREG